MSTPQNLLPNELHTGVSDLDAQHEGLFSEMQAIKNALMSPDADIPAGLRRLTQLELDMASHFAWEETQAAALAIAFAAHAAEHQRLLALMHSKIAEAHTGAGNIPALLVFLDRCFEMHVKHFDQSLGMLLRGTRDRG